jgi:uncharacterized membrane protein YeaQ/YmgE (transglycosylase-associated protein family)
MNFIVFLIVLALFGLLMGGLARLALPGKDPMTLPQTMAVGLAGSLIAGLVTWVISNESEGPSLFVSFVFTVLIVYVIRRRRGGGLIEPGHADSTRTEDRR